MATPDEIKQREIYIIQQLRKGHSRKWVASQLEEKYDISPSTAANQVNEIGAKLNKSLESLSEEAAGYIYRVLLKTIDDTISDDDRKSRLKALELLSKITKLGEDKRNVDIHFTFE